MLLIFAFIIGLFVGIALSKLIPRKAIGILRVNYSDPDGGPYLFLEIKQGEIETIRNKKYVLFEVDLEKYISPK